MPTHKKGHDKDRYYHLARDQGFRARSAFKLIQIDKRYDVLSKARVCIDLCAAPGGWCQVAAKAMKPGSIIVGVDLLPIREIRNVKTIVADITTAECRREVQKALSGWPADVVLCDGAPNIGSDYAKDAYVQNELVLAALKTATDHLVEGGTFISKIYRSKDYNSLMWVFQHFFGDVQAIKPNSSRSQSAEIFVVCLKYNKPRKIDPKMLDPNHVFQDVDDPGTKGVDVLHKKYGVVNKRSRSGYDDSLGMTLRAKASVADFIHASDPVRMLTDINEMHFSDAESLEYKNHPTTTDEIVTCFEDLRVLGKSDFRKLLRWRQKIKEEEKAARGEEEGGADDMDEEEQGTKSTGPLTDEEILQEMAQVRAERAHELRKEKKKSRKAQAAARTRLGMGMTNKSFGVEEDEELFGVGQFEGLDEMDADYEAQVRAEWERRQRVRVIGDEEAAIDEDGNAIPLTYEERGRLIVQGDEDLEEQMEEDYERFLKGRRDKLRGAGIPMDSAAAEQQDRTRSAKRARKAETAAGLIAARDANDEALVGKGKTKRQREQEQSLKNDMDAYVALLNDKGGSAAGVKKKGKGKSKGVKREGFEASDSDSDSDGDGEDEEEKKGFDESDFSDDDDEESESEEELEDNDGRAVDAVKRSSESNKNKAADRWFSHPLFKETLVKGTGDGGDDDDDDDNEEELEEEAGGGGFDENNETQVEESLSMPKSVKEQRKEKRKREMERNERKKEKRAQKDARESGLDKGEMSKAGSFEVVAEDDEEEEDEEIKAFRARIREGMGRSTGDDTADGGFEVVREEGAGADLPPRKDSRSYDSDEEDYDGHDRAVTLALGTMMLRKSRQKAMVDASYNRFAWNDATDLPSWFTDDEIRHNRPQVPVPPALLAQVKGKFQHTGTKDIKKVAEARMRKRKKAMTKLKAAKKQASALAQNSEMTESQKVRAIAKAMKGTKTGAPSKVYVVAKKTQAGSSATRLSSAKGKLKFVDKRMRNDQRALKRVEKKKKGVKKRKWH